METSAKLEGTHQGVSDVPFCPRRAHSRALVWLLPANIKHITEGEYKLVEKENEREGGDGQQKNKGKIQASAEEKGREWESNDGVNLSAERVFSPVMEMGKYILMIHAGHFHLRSANH